MIEGFFRADLHCHSTCSDGTLSPVEIIELALKNNLQGLSITDHDTISAYPVALAASLKTSLNLISGIEFSAMHRNTSVHILAYSFSPESQIIKDFCSKHQNRRIQRNREILSLLALSKMPLTEKEVDCSELPPTEHIIGRPHIASAMVKKGYVSTMQEAFNLYIGEGKPCYSAGSYFSVEETIDLIHQARGLAIIAHPHLVENSRVLQDLLTMPFDGIEGYYGRFNKEQCARWVKIGEKKGWLITGGSDFHGTIKPTLQLGNSWVNENTFRVLQNHFLANQEKIKS